MIFRNSDNCLPVYMA